MSAVVKLCHADYIRAHSRAPRGRASWRFVMGTEGGQEPRYHWTGGSLPFSEALRLVSRRARLHGFDLVVVLPRTSGRQAFTDEEA